VLKWPDAQTVKQAIISWTENVVAQHHDVIRVGYFGSYARGDWGVGSDLDLVIVVTHSDQPFERRAAQWDVSQLPVPTDVLVYTQEEWQSLAQRRFYEMLMQETVWVYDKNNE
jgi:predicted nucleotidyltransferase